jgi:CDP-2,3-bis-(O-geranylgeranyl)-sn-glycerol synthase
VFFAVLITALVTGATGYGLLVGAQIGLLAMLGDMLSSFIKRRLDMRSSSMAPFLDQVPESLLPACCMMSAFALQWRELVVLLLAFVMLELLLSKIMYKLGVRRKPY